MMKGQKKRISMKIPQPVNREPRRKDLKKKE